MYPFYSYLCHSCKDWLNFILKVNELVIKFDYSFQTLHENVAVPSDYYPIILSDLLYSYYLIT